MTELSDPQSSPLLMKAYLGDGVYAYEDFNGMGLKLTTENGVAITNTIYLEWNVLEALDGFRNRLKARDAAYPCRCGCTPPEKKPLAPPPDPCDGPKP